MPDSGPDDSPSFHEDMMRIVNRLPMPEEFRRVQHLILQRPGEPAISDNQLADVLDACPHLESIVLSAVPDTSDRTIVLLAEKAINLHGINLTGCTQVTDVGILELATKSPPLQCIQLNGVTGITDPSVSAIAKTCSRLIELELCDLPLLTPLSVRDIWSFSRLDLSEYDVSSSVLIVYRKLRTLRLARCPMLTEKAFPSSLGPELPDFVGNEKPLPPRPITWLDTLPPLILRHSAENLRVLDLTFCKLTDDTIEGIVTHAPKIQSLILSGCSLLTDRAVRSICKLGEHLDVLMLAHVANITDRAIVALTRSCVNLRCVDVACESSFARLMFICLDIE